MPIATAPIPDRPTAAGEPDEEREIIMPTFRGQQGNPTA
jgi:hypothetical protein